MASSSSASLVGTLARRLLARSGRVTTSVACRQPWTTTSTRAMSSASAAAEATASPSSLGLSSEQLKFFHDNGYLVIPDFWSRSTCSELIDRANTIVDEFEPETFSIFTTEEQTRHSDDFFLTSGDKVRCFFEEGAFDKDGNMVVDKSVSINKIGHAMHDQVPEFSRVTYGPRVDAIVRSLGYQVPMVVQSMYIFKQPGIGGAVNAHQDGTFLYTEPQSCTGLWWALEDCTLDNGCLWAVPGSHKMGCTRWFKRNPDGPGTVFEPPEEPEPLSEDGAVPLETAAGSLVLLHYALVHFRYTSHANMSPQSRHAYSVHLVEAGKGVSYPKANWLQRPHGRFNTFPSFAGQLADELQVGVGGVE